MRSSEVSIFNLDSNDCAKAYVDLSVDKEAKAALNIALIILIMIILLVGSMRLSSDIVQIVLDPTQRLLRTKRTSDALMDVFKAVSKNDDGDGLDTTITTVLQASRDLLSCKLVNIYFVDHTANSLRLLQSSRAGRGESAEAEDCTIFANGLTVEPDDSTILGRVWNSATEATASSPKRNNGPHLKQSQLAANLYWTAESKQGAPGVVNLLSTDGRMSRQEKVFSSVSNAIKKKQNLPDLEGVGALEWTKWTERWQNDPSLSPLHAEELNVGTVSSQLCMSIVADFEGEGRRVVGLVQAINKQVRVPARRRRQMTGEQLAFKEYDVDCLQLFCEQIAGLVEKKGKAAEFQRNVAEDDTLSQLIQSFSNFHSTLDAPVSQMWQQANKKIRFARAFAGTDTIKEEAGDVIPCQVKIRDLQAWGYGCLDHTPEELVAATVMMFADLGLTTEFRIPLIRLQNYVKRVYDSYNDVPYHNAYHAFSVAQGCFYIISQCEGWQQNLTKDQQLCMLVAALGHDSNHDGVNTTFHVSVESDVAELYNDQSPLEMMHARTALMALKGEDCNIFEGLDPSQKPKARESIVKLILATDMKFHAAKQDKLVAHDGVPFNLGDPTEGQVGWPLFYSCPLHLYTCVNLGLKRL